MFLVSDDEGDSYSVGWALIALILLNIGINVFIMLVMTGIKVRAKCRGKCTKAKKFDIDPIKETRKPAENKYELKD